MVRRQHDVVQLDSRETCKMSGATSNIETEYLELQTRNAWPVLFQVSTTLNTQSKRMADIAFIILAHTQ